jgi:hypothetical protein
MESVSLLLLWMAQLWQSGLKMASWAGPRRWKKMRFGAIAHQCTHSPFDMLDLASLALFL